jgi:hypothetical protein
VISLTPQDQLTMTELIGHIRDGTMGQFTREACASIEKAAAEELLHNVSTRVHEAEMRMQEAKVRAKEATEELMRRTATVQAMLKVFDQTRDALFPPCPLKKESDDENH